MGRTTLDELDEQLKAMLADKTPAERLKMLVLAAKYHGPESMAERKRKYDRDKKREERSREL